MKLSEELTLFSEHVADVCKDLKSSIDTFNDTLTTLETRVAKLESSSAS